jgi:hypothetical protein
MTTFGELAAAAQEELDVAEEATGQAMVYMVGAIACGVLDAYPKARWLELMTDPDGSSWVLAGDVLAADGEVIADGTEIPEGARALVPELDAHYRAWTEYYRQTQNALQRSMRWLDLVRASQIRIVDAD